MSYHFWEMAHNKKVSNGLGSTQYHSCWWADGSSQIKTNMAVCSTSVLKLISILIKLLTFNYLPSITFVAKLLLLTLVCIVQIFPFQYQLWFLCTLYAKIFFCWRWPFSSNVLHSYNRLMMSTNKSSIRKSFTRIKFFSWTWDRRLVWNLLWWVCDIQFQYMKKNTTNAAPVSINRPNEMFKKLSNTK